MKIGTKAHYTAMPGYVVAGYVTAVHADGYVTFDAGSRGSWNLHVSDPALEAA